MNGSELICEILKSKGVKHIFGLFGDIQTDFAHAVRKSPIKWIGVHNEKSGGFMADIYARTSCKPGVVFSTLGPGATNLTSALANATQDRSPLIAISDQVPLNEFNLQTHQYVDLEKAFHPKTGITKFTAVIKNLDDIERVFEKAFSEAMSEPKGAVHISIPADLFGKKFENKKKKFKTKIEINNKKYKNTILHREILKKINESDIPSLVIVGGSVDRCGAKKSFKSFIEKYKLPVLTTFRGKNAIPSDHPQCLGTISRHLGDALTEILNKVSNIILVGYDYNEGVKPSLWGKKKNEVINIDCYDNRIFGIFNPPTFIGDLDKLFKKLTFQKAPQYKEDFNFQAIKNKVNDIVKIALDVKNDSLHPKRIMDAINKLYSSEESIIICDVGLNKYYSGLLLKAHDKNQILFSNGMSSMAFSSGALGAKVANPKKNVIVLVGDGGFLMDPQEIITTIQNHKPVIWIVFNNGGLGLIEQAQLKNGDKHHGVNFRKVIFKKLAFSMGAYGEHIEKRKDILPILKKVKKMNRTAVIDVAVEYTSNR